MSSCGLSYVCLKRDSSDIYSSSSKDMSHVTLESPITFLKTISPHTVILLGLKPSTYEWRERKTGHSSAHNTSIQVQMVSQASDLGSVLRIFFYWVSLPSTMESMTILTSMIYCGLCSRYEESNSSSLLLFSSKWRMSISKTLLVSL